MNNLEAIRIALQSLWADALDLPEFAARPWIERVNRTLIRLGANKLHSATLGLAVISADDITYWSAGHVPTAAPGLKVNAFARGLKHPRWIQTMPNGDVLIAEATSAGRAVMRNLFDYAMKSTMRRAAAVGVSANRITRFTATWDTSRLDDATLMTLLADTLER